MGFIVMGIMCVKMMCGMMGSHEGHSAADTEKKHKDSGIENHEASGNHQDAEVKVETEMQKEDAVVKKEADNPDKKNNIEKTDKDKMKL
jgi:hypothetical protein